MDEHLIELMGSILASHRELGEIEALLNWSLCYDLNGKTAEHRKLRSQRWKIRREIDVSMINIEIAVEDADFASFVSECKRFFGEAKTSKECEIEFDHRPTGISYNRKALINKTDCLVPEDIQMGLSFGWKFLFPYSTTDENLHQALAELDKCIEDTIPVLSQHEAFAETAKILKNKEDFRHNDLLCWLSFVSLRTQEFFAENQHVFATRSDKGGHTVIINVDDYDSAIGDMLRDTHTYQRLEDDENPLQDLISEEKRLIYLIKHNKKCSHLLNGCIEPDISQLGKFYGLPKVHKEVFKLRPIVALNSAPGNIIGKVFGLMLKSVFPMTSYHVKDSYKMKEFIDEAWILEEDVLVSYDAVSMYTRIPGQLVKDIIMDKYIDFFIKFGIGKSILDKLLNFLLNECVVFSTPFGTYKQKEGIPMGGIISPSLARIVMDRVISHVYNRVPEISFIKVFVDDTLAAVHHSKTEEVLRAFNDFDPRMKFTMEHESYGGSINFLNLTVIRQGNFLISNWYRKGFASGRLLNYYSSHKRTTVMGTAEGFIKTVLKLSDPIFYQRNKNIVIETLRDNSFPETLIEVLLLNFYTYSKSDRDYTVNGKPFNFYEQNLYNNVEFLSKKPKVVEDRHYRIFPHAIAGSRKIKRLIHRLKRGDIVLADSTRNTKINSIRTRKVSPPLGSTSNVIILLNCQCKGKYKIQCAGFNQTGKMTADGLITNFKRCHGDMHAFRRVKYLKGLHYKGQTKYLLKYVKYKYRNNTINEQANLPNWNFAEMLRHVDGYFIESRTN